MADSDAATHPWRRHLPDLEAGLAAWARDVHGATVADVTAPSSGFANDTVLFRLGDEHLVARLAPAPDSPYPTFPTFDLDMQRRVIELVRARTSVPAPEVVHLERSDRWLGAPFMVTRLVEGVTAADNPNYLMDPDGWFLQGSPEQWQRFETAMVEMLVELHRVVDDDETAFLRPDAPGDTALARQLAYQRQYYEWAREGQRIPMLERAHDLLAKTIPPNDRSVLNWGDGRPANVIYRDFEPVAALDWEMATVGPPEVDVAWLTFFQRFFGGMAAQFGISVPAMFDRDETAAIYERLSGSRLDDLGWYEAFSGFRLGIIISRMAMRSAACGLQPLPDDPDDMFMFRPLLEQLLSDL